jgi:two-component system cell cycle sensor histidine kinase/response regulator CckA
VLTDLLMPNMDGVALAKVVRKMDPKLPVLATSGNSRPEQMAEGGQVEFAGFLRKPYTGQTLASAIHGALNPQPPARRESSLA